MSHMTTPPDVGAPRRGGLETLSRLLRRVRHGVFANLPAPLTAAVRRAVLLTLDVATLGRGRAVMVAGRYPMRVAWSRIAIDFTTFEASFTSEFGRVLSTPGVVFDIGANLGEWSALAATLVGAGRVHIFEPNPASWREVRRIWRHNRLASPGGLFAGFAANADRCPTDALRHALSGHWPPVVPGEIAFESLSDARDLPMVRLDTYCDAAGVVPDVIKIDVEGAEGEVLRGAEEILRRSGPTIFLSLHPWALPEFGDSREGLLTWLDAHGYECRLLGVDHEEHWLCTHSHPGAPA